MKNTFPIARLLPLSLLLLVGAAAIYSYRIQARKMHSGREAVLNAREAIFNEDRRTVSEAMREYEKDKGKPPQTLEDLVDADYLKSIPEFPDPPLLHRKPN
jgi:hypothetical protein